MTKGTESLLEELKARVGRLSRREPKEVLGKVIGFSESRHILQIKDIFGEVVELVPLEKTTALLHITLDHPTSQETLNFWVPMPTEALDFYTSSRIRVARSIPHLSEQLDNSLKGVKDAHDLAVDLAEEVNFKSTLRVAKKKAKKKVPKKPAPRSKRK